jgi:hypothetical protein
MRDIEISDLTFLKIRITLVTPPIVRNGDARHRFPNNDVVQAIPPGAANLALHLAIIAVQCSCFMR